MNGRANIWLTFLGLAILAMLALLLGSNDWTYRRYNDVLQEVSALKRQGERIEERLGEMDKKLAAGAVVAASQVSASQTPAAGTEEFQDYELYHKAAPKGGVLRLPFGSDPESLNPITSNDASASDVGSYVLNALLAHHPQTRRTMPELAVRWSVDEKKLEIVFDLRPGVVWSDGTPFTARDVLFSFNLIRNKRINAAPLQSYYSDLDAVEAEGAGRIRVRWKKPYFKMLDMAGGISVLPAHFYTAKYGIEDELSPAFADKFNADIQLPGVSTGAYLFKDWETGRLIRLERNPRAWQAGLGNFDEVRFAIITDRTAQMQQLKNGEIDEMPWTVQEYLDEKDNALIQGRCDVHTYLAPVYTYIGYNLRRPPFNDARVRRAFTLLLDREAVVKNVLHGFGKVISGPFFMKSEHNDPAIAPWPYDPPAGLKLLEEAGWKRGAEGMLRNASGNTLAVQFITNEGNPEREQAGRIFAEQLRKSGVDVDFRPLNWNVLLDRVNKINFQAFILGWQLDLSDPDPYQIWHSSQTVAEGSNHVGYINPEVDRLIERIRACFDASERVRLCRAIHRILHEDQPYTFLWSRQSFLPVARDIKNQQVYPSGLSELEWYR